MLLRKAVIITVYFTVFGSKTIIKIIRTVTLFLKIQSLSLKGIIQKPLQQRLWNLAGFILFLLPSCKWYSILMKNKQKDKAIHVFHVLVNGDQCFVVMIFPLDRLNCFIALYHVFPIKLSHTEKQHLQYFSFTLKDRIFTNLF